MIISHNAFNLIPQPPTQQDSAKCSSLNRPTVNVLQRARGYTYIEIDFITCDYCLSPYGQADLQNRLNHVMYDNWTKGNFNLKFGKTSINTMYTCLRLTEPIVHGLIDYLNSQCDNPDYWIQYRDGERMLEVERYNPDIYVNSIYHPKENSKKLKVRV
ncbi:hypothetical protein EVU91_07285 [Macrococcoides bohemicum]|uniref:hypothetical protein n=1 Tax=Macrococcoides bohemicum TaxID=1903056 RepID=UPI001059ECB7|nr:hypothetical protein [Macrococcus bohemicus]TDL37707.1 hypothetical protein EVU91_07285 [Macrococcus bohemicus]